MKKTYIIPEMQVIKIHITHLLSGSNPNAYADEYDGTQFGRDFGGDWDEED